jgi:adenylate kinase family enzyme
MVIILMGVSGSGKTTIATQLAEVLGWPSTGDAGPYLPLGTVDH